MDEVVIRSMARWPDVPDVFGWLALDRRGNWLVKCPGGGFERIGNAALCAFIGRNYQHDDDGRWFFQNGPQRVFVNLHHMPLVYRIDGGGKRLLAHSGLVAQALRAAWLDDAGGLLLQTDLGAGSLDDRDLAEALALMRDAAGGSPGEAAIERGSGLQLVIGSDCISLGAALAAEVATRFGFVATPRPAPGQADC